MPDGVNCLSEGVKDIAARFDSNGHQRRPSRDPINAVLSFGYSMLTNERVVACRLASLEPTSPRRWVGGTGVRVVRASHPLMGVRPMRRCYLVCYDIRDPKRLRRTHKLVKAYGEAWQYSVFYCTLKAIDRGWRTPSAKRSISRWTSS